MFTTETSDIQCLDLAYLYSILFMSHPQMCITVEYINFKDINFTLMSSLIVSATVSRP